jgi:hypothetical protein
MALKYDKILGTIREKDSFVLDVNSTNYLRIINAPSGSIIDFVTAPANTITCSGLIYQLSGITDALSAFQKLDTDIYVLNGSYGTADAIQVNYSPSVYVPVSGTIYGHLDGINNYLNTSFPARTGSLSAVPSGVTTNVITVPISAGGAGIIFNYSANNNAINIRTGTMQIAYTTSAIVYNEHTTTDIGTTSAITFTPIISGTNVNLNCFVTSGSSWSVKYSRDLL